MLPWIKVFVTGDLNLLVPTLQDISVNRLIEMTSGHSKAKGLYLYLELLYCFSLNGKIRGLP